MEEQKHIKQFNIRKKIAKHGCNSIIVIPKLLQGDLKPKTIVDLGAGLNPFSCVYMDLNDFNYYSYDINEEDIKILNEFFKIRPDFFLTIINFSYLFCFIHC